MYFDQDPYEVRFEWGERGLEAVASGCDTIVVVDVMSFSTCVDIAVSRGAVVLPYRSRDASAADHARTHHAELAFPRGLEDAAYSLSPDSLIDIPAGTRLVLPSPNGATLSLQAQAFGTTIAGCLRNAAAVAESVNAMRGSVAMIACGERWEDCSLRPSSEDLVGAGAIISHLGGSRSPEAEAACATYEAVRGRLEDSLCACASGRELAQLGYDADVRLAAECNVSDTVPVFDGVQYRAVTKEMA